MHLSDVNLRKFYLKIHPLNPVIMYSHGMEKTDNRIMKQPSK